MDKTLIRYLKVKEDKAFDYIDYQMYPAIFIDLSIWQATFGFGLPFPTPICCVSRLKKKLDILRFSIDKVGKPQCGTFYSIPLNFNS